MNKLSEEPIKIDWLFFYVDNIVNNNSFSFFNEIKDSIFLIKIFAIMNSRNLDLKRIRPDFMTTTINNAMSTEERFQNLVLIPIIKLQNDLFIEVFKNYATKHKNVFYDLSLEKRIDYIGNSIHKDMKFRNSVKGMIIGMFTIEEYKLYIQNSSALNKRMMNIVKERIIESIQIIDESSTLTAV